MVKPISIKRFRWPADVLRYDGWLCFRFSRSLTVVEELTAQRGIDVSLVREHQVRAADRPRLKKRRWLPTPRWHLDEMVCLGGGTRKYLWRAVNPSKLDR